jgi:hypothetical protein
MTKHWATGQPVDIFVRISYRFVNSDSQLLRSLSGGQEGIGILFDASL